MKQVPDLLVCAVTEKLNQASPGPSLLVVLNALKHSLRKRWQSVLQFSFYRIDRERLLFHAEMFQSHSLPGGRFRALGISCGLKEVAGAVAAELERVAAVLCPDSSQDPPPRDKVSSFQVIQSSSLISRGDSFCIIACTDTSTYSDPSVTGDQHSDTELREAGSTEAFEEAGDSVSTCQLIRHSCVLFQDLFCLCTTLLDSVHHHVCEVSDCLFLGCVSSVL